jgi:hypothetical protein
LRGRHADHRHADHTTFLRGFLQDGTVQELLGFLAVLPFDNDGDSVEIIRIAEDVMDPSSAEFAARERVLWKNIASIFWFRFMQFHGTRIGTARRVC